MSFQLPDSGSRERDMLRILHRLGVLVMVGGCLIVASPFLLIGALARLWSAIELRALFKGDEAARDRAAWKARL
jgi:hypothetical protein